MRHLDLEVKLGRCLQCPKIHQHALLLNMLFRVITGKVQNVMKEAYHRIPFEDWAYWIEGTQSSDIEWGSWVLGFFLTSLYTAGLISIPAGIAMGILPLWLAGLGVVIVYTLIRALGG